MTELTLQTDDEVLAALRSSPDEFMRELKLAAAIHWYGRGQISQEKAANFAGLDRTDFLLELARRGENAFIVDFADLEKQLRRG